MTEKEKIIFEEMTNFSDVVKTIRVCYPRFAREIDRMVFDVGANYTPKYGQADCDCETLTFEKFHEERNFIFNAAEKVK